MNPRFPMLILSATCFASCATPSLPDVEKNATPAAVSNVAAAPNASGSGLSYGTVTSRVERNKTTQTDLIEVFGGPNISSVDADGSEVWIYERSLSQTDVATQSKDYRGALSLGASFGYPSFGASAAASGSAEKSSGQSSSTTSSRTLTVIVKFNANKTVKEFSARASSF